MHIKAKWHHPILYFSYPCRKFSTILFQRSTASSQDHSNSSKMLMFEQPNNQVLVNSKIFLTSPQKDLDQFMVQIKFLRVFRPFLQRSLAQAGYLYCTKDDVFRPQVKPNQPCISARWHQAALLRLWAVVLVGRGPSFILQSIEIIPLIHSTPAVIWHVMNIN